MLYNVGTLIGLELLLLLRAYTPERKCPYQLSEQSRIYTKNQVKTLSASRGLCTSVSSVFGDLIPS